jgi:hypothetical protein
MQLDDLRTWQAIAGNLAAIEAVALLSWFCVLYVLAMMLGSRGSPLALSWLERRCAQDQDDAGSTSHRPWQRFRAKHLQTARAVERAHQMRFRFVLWLALGILVIGVILIVMVAVASMLAGATDVAQTPLFALFFLAPLPLLITSFASRAFWNRRTRAEWRVVLLGDRLSVDAEASIDQDFVAQRTGHILAVLGRRFPKDTAWRRTATEHRLWLPRLAAAAQMRAALMVTDQTERTRWNGWVATWLDRVSASFSASTSSQPPSERDLVAIDTHDRPAQTLVWMIVGSSLLAGASLLMAGAAQGADWTVVQDVWNSTVTQVTAVVALLGAIVSLIKYLRGSEK